MKKEGCLLELDLAKRDKKRKKKKKKTQRNIGSNKLRIDFSFR